MSYILKFWYFIVFIIIYIILNIIDICLIILYVYCIYNFLWSLFFSLYFYIWGYIRFLLPFIIFYFYLCYYTIEYKGYKKFIFFGLDVKKLSLKYFYFYKYLKNWNYLYIYAIILFLILIISFYEVHYKLNLILIIFLVFIYYFIIIYLKYKNKKLINKDNNFYINLILIFFLSFYISLFFNINNTFKLLKEDSNNVNFLWNLAAQRLFLKDAFDIKVVENIDSIYLKLNYGLIYHQHYLKLKYLNILNNNIWNKKINYFEFFKEYKKTSIINQIYLNDFKPYLKYYLNINESDKFFLSDNFQLLNNISNFTLNNTLFEFKKSNKIDNLLNIDYNYINKYKINSKQINLYSKVLLNELNLSKKVFVPSNWTFKAEEDLSLINFLFNNPIITNLEDYIMSISDLTNSEIYNNKFLINYENYINKFFSFLYIKKEIKGTLDYLILFFNWLFIKPLNINIKLSNLLESNNDLLYFYEKCWSYAMGLRELDLEYTLLSLNKLWNKKYITSEDIAFSEIYFLINDMKKINFKLWTDSLSLKDLEFKDSFNIKRNLDSNLAFAYSSPSNDFEQWNASHYEYKSTKTSLLHYDDVVLTDHYLMHIMNFSDIKELYYKLYNYDPDFLNFMSSYLWLSFKDDNVILVRDDIKKNLEETISNLDQLIILNKNNKEYTNMKLILTAKLNEIKNIETIEINIKLNE